MIKRPLCTVRLRRLPTQFSWVDQRLVRDRRIDSLSHGACALYLFLITVADAQGLSYFAERSLRQRLAMSEVSLRQARELLIQQGLIAYEVPLYQVLDLGGPPPAVPEPPSAHDEPVDTEAMFKRIWEVLS